MVLYNIQNPLSQWGNQIYYIVDVHRVGKPGITENKANSEYALLIS